MEDKLRNLIPPFKCEDNKTYIDTLETQLKDYHEFLHCELQDKMTDSDYQALDKINESIISAIKSYLKGKSGEAYNKIKEILSCSSLSCDEMVYKLNNKNALIRMRKSAIPFYKREDLFHIPFSERHRVSKQRYSIDGLPCLYLAGCAYTAWLELGRPSFNELWASAFRATKDIPVFDLCYRLDEIIDKEVQLSNVTKTKLLFYPFVLATSYRTKYPFSPFHEEYIISNILLQWVMENKKFTGIRYLSTKIEKCDKEKLWMTANIVLPPKGDDEKSEYDNDLCQNFEMTIPHQCFLLENYSHAGGVVALEVGGGMEEFSEKSESCLEHLDIEILNNYNVTRFYNIDGYLRKNLKYAVITPTYIDDAN